VIGTPYYMSPEQGMGKLVTGAADQYSVAVMAYRMLCGAVPFEGSSAIDILHKHCMMPAPPLDVLRPGLPAPVYRAIHRGLEKDPAMRFPTVGALVEAMAQLGPVVSRVSQSAVATVSLPAPARPKPPVRPPPRHRSYRMPLVLLTLSALGAGAYFGWQQWRDPVPPPETAEEAPPVNAPVPVPEPPPTGTVHLTGVPPGATVTVAGALVQGSRVELPPGTHPLRIEVAGFEPFTRDLAVGAGDSLPVAYAGRRVTAPPAQRTATGETPPPTQRTTAPATPQPVQLRIGVRPPGGVQVYVNGEPMPQGRREIETQVLPGQHLIRVEHPTLGVKDTTVTVRAGEPLLVIIRLGG